MFAVLAIASASAQYVCLQTGAKMEYKSLAYQGGKAIPLTTKAEVIRVSQTHGVMTVFTKETTPVPGSQMIEKSDTTTAIYTAADNSTNFVMSTPEGAKKSVIDMMKLQMQVAGESVSQAEMDAFVSSIKVSGELSITINPDMADGTKLPDKRIRISIGNENMSYNIWEAKVEGREEITTPAGTFKCLKVSYVNMINAGGENKKIHVTEWFAPGLGAVKVMQTIEGKLLITQELVKFAKPRA